MNRKLVLGGLLITSLIFVTGYILTNSTLISLCTAQEYTCRDFYNNLGDPLFYGAGALVTVFILLLLMPRAIPVWKKFAVWFVPMTTLLFIFYPDPGSGDLFSPYPETVFQFMSAVYVFVSVVLISYTYLRKK